MHRPAFSFFKYAVLGIALAISCAPSEIEVPGDDDEDNDDDGRSGTGASPGLGGSSGATFTGGTPATGGSPATGGFSGTVATGGFSGTPPTGGSFPGGTPGSGGGAGTFPQGGTGVSGAAGTPLTAGTGGAATVACGAAFMTEMDGFVRAPAGATGCWHGYAYAGGDTGSMVMPMSFATCGMGCMLRVTGMVGPATAANMYVGVAYLGFNVAQTAGSSTAGTIAPTGTSLQVTYTKTAGPSVIRAQITSAGGATTWCATLTASPATILYTAFNTACWDMSGTAYAKQPIEAVQLVAPGDMAAAALDMTLVSVKDM